MSEMPPPFDALWFQILVGALVGFALGSFITMLSYRLPRKLSIVHPRSHCPSCKTTLGARDLVPVASWVCSGGKCQHCGKKIGARYVLIEIIAGIACAIAFAMVGFQPQLLIALAGITAVMTAAIIQIEKKN